NWLADIFRLVDTSAVYTYTRPYSDWVKGCVRDNKPWDAMAREMLTTDGRVIDHPAAGYLMRDKDMPLDNLNNTVRIFLGTRIGCAQCHDHPFDRWTQKEFYQVAAFTFGTVTSTGGGDTRYWNANPNTRLMEQFAGLEQEEEDRRRNYYPYTRLIG